MISSIYIITPDKPINISHLIYVIKKYSINILQYRRKIKCNNIKFLEAEKLLKICNNLKVKLIINDDIFLARKIGAAGVHLGKSDTSITIARKYLGNNAMIGVSCYADINLAIEAERLGANYCAFGSVFQSSTKVNAKLCPLSVIKEAKKLIKIPIIAIGGINFTNYKKVINSGADSVAMINSLSQI